jgi:hypothetical protein
VIARNAASPPAGSAGSPEGDEPDVFAGLVPIDVVDGELVPRRRRA